MTRVALEAALLGHAISIGRWIVGFIVDHGAESLAAYMRHRMGVFKRRQARVRRRRFTWWRSKRLNWLSGRIARWESAAEWLIANAVQLGTDAADVSEGLATHLRKLPETAPGERFSPWRAT